MDPVECRSGRVFTNTVAEEEGADQLFSRFDATPIGETAHDDYRNEPNTFGWIVEIDPRGPNRFGHIIRWREDNPVPGPGEDPGGFSWDISVFAGEQFARGEWTSHWPGGAPNRPRSATLAISRIDGGKVGT